ncbi:MAG: hypothetical protein QOJ15_8495 [Bradyrhizobium sp.]|nr:hypothetical protein [Bradyrhizobium sp.]
MAGTGGRQKHCKTTEITTFVHFEGCFDDRPDLFVHQELATRLGT